MSYLQIYPETICPYCGRIKTPEHKTIQKEKKTICIDFLEDVNFKTKEKSKIRVIVERYRQEPSKPKKVLKT